MSARPPLARLLGPLPLLALLLGCAATVRPPGTVEGAADTAAVPTDTLAGPEPAPGDPAVVPFQPSAPNEIVSEAARTQRTFAVGDMIRAGIATVVEQGPPGVLRVGVGRAFHAHASREFHFRRLASAYYSWTGEGRPLVVELWEGGQKIGEYSNDTFELGPEHTTPLACPEDTTAGPCGPNEPPVPAPVAGPPGGPERQAPRLQPSPGRERSGFHGGLGLGAGVADLACRGCEDPSEVGFSGFLSLGAWINDRTVLGVEGTGWTRSESGTSSDVYSLTGTVTRYLGDGGGLFLGAGLGLVGYRQRPGAGEPGQDVSAKSLGFSGRLGYDIGSGGYVVAPYVGFVRTFDGADFKADGDDVGFNAAFSNLQFGLSIGVR